MGDMETGGCLCGDLTYKFDRDAVISAHHCHCKDCQRSTGSGKATLILVPNDALETTGELKTYTVIGSEGAHVNRGFCPNCGCQTMSNLDEMPVMTIVKVGTLDDSSWVKIDSSFWADTAEDWSPVDPRVPSFEKNPPTV